MYWYRMSVQDVLESLRTNSITGLTSFECNKRILKYNKNSLNCDLKNKSKFWKKLSKQLCDFMIIVLFVSAILSFIVSCVQKDDNYIDVIIILFIVVLNIVTGILQENRAEKAIDSLKSLSSPYARVFRDNKAQRILSENLVPGDIIVLKTGDLVCADARVIESSGFYVEESAITGESESVFKNENIINNTEEISVNEQINMIFSGTIVTRGHAKAVVTETGLNTQVGKISRLINTEQNFKTPLSRKLEKTGKIIGIFIIIVSVLVFVLGIFQNINFLEIFMISVSLAVAAIPEGLPAVVTIVLAGGVKKMAARNTIVRNLSAVETLGHIDVICSDKTGTLTQNKMTLQEIKIINNNINLDSEISRNILKLGVLCNNSIISNDIIKGEPTENSILNSAKNYNININKLREDYKRVFEIPFSSSRKYMLTVHKNKNNYRIIIKGALDIILNKCKYYNLNNNILELDKNIINKINQDNSDMTKRALRVICIAYKNLDNLNNFDIDNLEKDLIFFGILGICDPIRPEAKIAVQECKRAGIKPVMITGDHVCTAESIARSLDILDNNSKIMTGAELNNISTEKLSEIINSYTVFARVSPEHKVKIIQAFQKNHNIVAMTGDGINDAPALKISDIGCAMGKSGTDAAKSASDMIITDDNFKTIVEAIKYGRGMYENIKKTIHFLLSTNIGEVLTVLLGFLLRVPAPLLAVHLLWINTVTDTFPALALGVDPINSEIMNRAPINSKKSLFANGTGYNIIVEGCFIATIGFLAYTIGRVFFDVNSSEPIIGRTMCFATLGFSQIIHTFNIRTKKSVFRTNIFDNIKLLYSVVFCMFLQAITIIIPSFNNFFKTCFLNLNQWLIIILLSLSVLIISEIEKFFQKNKQIL